MAQFEAETTASKMMKSPSQVKANILSFVLSIFVSLLASAPFSASQATTDAKFREQFNGYDNPFSELGDSNRSWMWIKIYQFLNQTTTEQVNVCDRHCSNGVRPSNIDKAYYSVFDVLFTNQKDRKIGENFPTEYLPRL